VHKYAEYEHYGMWYTLLPMAFKDVSILAQTERHFTASQSEALTHYWAAGNRKYHEASGKQYMVTI
jgi:hypothetical protein